MARGISWGLSHINPLGGGPDKNCFIIRFDCALSRDAKRPEFKGSNVRYSEDTWFQRVTALPESWKARILQEQSQVDQPTVISQA